MDLDICLISEGYHTQFKLLEEFYQKGLHCDLEIRCQGQFGTIQCHRFIFSNISEWAKIYVTSSKHLDKSLLVLPSSCSLDHTKIFIDHLYKGLAGLQSIQFPPSCNEIAMCFNVGNAKEENLKEKENLDKSSSNCMEEEIGEPDMEFEIETEEFVSQEIGVSVDGQEKDPLEEEPEIIDIRNVTQPKHSDSDKGRFGLRLESGDQSITSKSSGLGDHKGLLFYLTAKKNPPKTAFPKSIKLFPGKPPCGNIAAQFFKPPYYKSFSLKKVLTNIDVLHQIIVGIKKCSNDSYTFLAKPVAWTSAEYDLIPHQFELYKKYVKSCIQLSDKDLLMQSALMESPEMFFRKKRLVLQSFKAKYKIEPSHLYDGMLKEFNQRLKELTECKIGGKQSYPAENEQSTFVLTNDLETADCEGVIILAISNIGTFGFPITNENGTEKERAKGCTSSLFNAWHNHSRVPFQHHPFLEKQSESAIKVVKSVEALKAVMNTSDYLVCEECGWKRQNLTKNDHWAFTTHVQKHKMENEDCGCGLEFENLKSKRIHMQIAHSNLDRIKCDFCNVVGTTNKVAKHIEFSHKIKNIICEECGITCKKEADLAAHHRYKHKVFECKNCRDTFLGETRFKKHQAQVHGRKRQKALPKPGQCEECDYVCKNIHFLKHHVLNVHTQSDAKPHKCEHCGKGYGNKHSLIRHLKSCQANLK